MPDSQQPMHDNNAKETEAYHDWASEVSKGVHQILTGHRAHFIPEKSKLDLCACLNLLEGDDPLTFDWDITMYTNPPPLRAPRLQTAKVRGEQKYSGPDSDEDCDDDELDTIARPQWSIGEVRIVKMTVPPFWAMVRYV